MFFLNGLLFWLKIVVLSPKLNVLSSKIFKTKSLKKEDANQKTEKCIKIENELVNYEIPHEQMISKDRLLHFHHPLFLCMRKFNIQTYAILNK